jgi:hypothetical protein
MTRPAEKVLLVGWDAADWEIIHPLVDAGQMPHLARLIRGGAWGELASLEPMLSPMLWTSIATGKRPHKHGIHGFTEPLPDARGIRAVASTSRTTKAIWNILTQSNLRSHHVAWYASHPAEPIRGVSVSNHFSVVPRAGHPWTLAEGTIHPAELGDTLAGKRVRPEQIQLRDLRAFIPNNSRIGPAQDPRLYQCAVILAETANTHAAVTWIMEHQPWDFLAVLYDGIDHFSHLFIEYHPPKPAHVSDNDFKMYEKVIAACYRLHDLMLGRLLELAGDRATVLVVSDHGFRTGDRRLTETIRTLEGLSMWHRPQGICVMHGPAIRAGIQLAGASLLDVTPTILTLFGLSVGDDMDGRPWLEAIAAAIERRRIASWDQVPGDAGMHPAELRLQPTDSHAAIRHLVELGYLNPPDADVEKAMEECQETNQYNLGRSLIDAGLPAEAIEVLQPLVDKHPQNVAYRKSLCDAYHVSR